MTILVRGNLEPHSIKSWKIAYLLIFSWFFTLFSSLKLKTQNHLQIFSTVKRKIGWHWPHYIFSSLQLISHITLSICSIHQPHNRKTLPLLHLSIMTLSCDSSIGSSPLGTYSVLFLAFISCVFSIYFSFFRLLLCYCWNFSTLIRNFILLFGWNVFYRLNVNDIYIVTKLGARKWFEGFNWKKIIVQT
jgi:hypothetical protein